MLSDPLSIGAAVGGGLLGLFVMVRWGGSHGVAPEPASRVAARPRPTRYASRHPASSAPILIALGLAAVGIALAASAEIGSAGFLLLIPGAGLLVGALRSLVRRQPIKPVTRVSADVEEQADSARH